MVTDMRITDTYTEQGDLFGERASGAVTPLIGANPGLRWGDIDSTNGLRTPGTTRTPGCRTSRTATSTTTTSRTSTGRSWSANETAARLAGFFYELLVEAYTDCRLTKRNTEAALAFEIDQERGLYDLYLDLVAGTYQPGPSKCFVITRPRPREVWAAEFRDRIVHHLVYNHIAAPFHRSFIADTCACIPGRGTLYAAQRLEAMIRSRTHNWSRRVYYLKIDIDSFFVSINKHILCSLVARRVPEPWWRELTLQILMHDPRPGAKLLSSPALMARVPAHKSLLQQPAHLGLPIGNLPSQFGANVYLNVVDQHIKHRIKARHYIRYVDDMVLLHEDPAWLNAARVEIERVLAERLELKLNPSKTILQPVDRGVDFVGHLIKPWRRQIRPRTVREALTRLARAADEDVHATANSYYGMLRQATHSHKDRTRLSRLILRRGFSVDMKLTKTYRRSTA